MPDDPAVSVVVPVYNERESILSVLHELEQALATAEVVWEIVVVDDDSPDLTWELVRQHYRDQSRVRVLRRTKQSGLSSAVLDGFETASGSILCCIDGDGQHPAERILDLIEAADGGIAVGSRHVDGGSIEGWPLSRKFISKIASGISHVGLPSSRRLSDPMSGFFAVDSRAVGDDLFDRADPHGYKILLDLVVRSDVPVSEVPITFACRTEGESKLTVDEQVKFVEQTVDLGLVDRGLAVQGPLLVRSIELGIASGAAILLLLVGIIVGGLDGAVGAGLIGGAGGLFSLAMMRYLGTTDTWEDSAA